MSQNRQFSYVTLLAGVMGQVGCLVVLLIGLALGVGLLVDRLLDTGGIFTALFMLGSVPVTLYLTVRVSMAAARRAQAQIEAQQAEDKEETTERESKA